MPACTCLSYLAFFSILSDNSSPPFTATPLLFAILSKSSEITFFYSMSLMLFAYVFCSLQCLLSLSLSISIYIWPATECTPCTPCTHCLPRTQHPVILAGTQTKYVCRNSFISFSTVVVTCPQSAILFPTLPPSFLSSCFPLLRFACHLHFLLLLRAWFLYPRAIKILEKGHIHCKKKMGQNMMLSLGL